MPEEAPEITRNPPLSETDKMTVEAQTLLINQRAYEKDFPADVITDKDDKDAQDLKKKQNRERDYRLDLFDHAERFANNQPYDTDQAKQGLDFAYTIASARAANAKKQPDNALAATKDMTIIAGLRVKLSDKISASGN